MSLPDWINSPPRGLLILARDPAMSNENFYGLLSTLLEAAYNSGRLSVLQDAWDKGTAAAIISPEKP